MTVMSRGLLVRFVLVLLLLAGCVAIALNKDPRLGLDLSGGTQLLYETKDSPNGTEANEENTDKTIEVLRGRVDALGVSEPSLTRSGSNRILIELPDVQDPEAAEEAIGRTAQLTIHPVRGTKATAAEKPTDEGGVILPDEQGIFLDLGKAQLEGNDISAAEAAKDENGIGNVVNVDFSGTGSDKFGDLSKEAACATGDLRRIAIVLDDEIISSPQVTVNCGAAITGTTSITGDFTLEEAQNLAILIEGGALPLELEQMSRSVVGPSLGEAAIDASFKAGIIGIILTLLFITFVYRFVGFLATIALTSYALLSYALLLAMGSTLTLPGLAGFVLAIGLAIDANVLVFERAKEEYHDYRSNGLRRALGTGFNKAWSAIIDTNVTTLLAAGLLFMLGSGAIKGFGITLVIGTIASMISALVIARVLTEMAVSTKWLAKRPALTGIGHIGSVRTWIEKKNFNIMGRRGMWLGVTSVVLLIALAGIAVKGLNWGLEFTGGRVLEYSTTQPLNVDEARAAVEDAGHPTAQVQEADGGDRIAIRVGKLSDAEADKIEAAIAEAGGGAKQERDDVISASFGTELRDKAIIAFILAFAAQMVYLGIRFKWTFGLSAILAMASDVLIVVGLFAWLGRPIDGIFLAAIMSVIGLSVNDTVVLFDRIRERWWSATSEQKFAERANKAILETIPRTVNTGLGAMFILAALMFLGGDSLRDFAMALLVGLIVGTLSSTFQATPILTYLNDKFPMDRKKKERDTFERDESGAVI